VRDDFRIHEWLVQPQLNVINSKDRSTRIEPRVMEVLVYLAKHADQVVTKDSMMQAIWGGRFVTEEVVTTSIFELRRALGDDARNPRFIQTIPKKGYRFIAPVIFTEEEKPLDVASKSNEHRLAGSSRLRKAAAAGATVMMFLALIVLKTTVWPGRKTTDTNTESVNTVRTVNPQAIESYTKGRELFARRNEDSLNKAIKQFEHAIQLDPNYALAYTGLADSYIVLETHNYLRREEAGPAARAAALTALQMDESLAEAHASIALVKLSYDWDWSGAETEFKQAIALNSDYAMAHTWYSQYLLAAGRIDECLREIKRARDLDPRSFAVRMTAGLIYVRLRQYDAAAEEYRTANEIDPNNATAVKSLGYIYEKKSMFKEAAAAYEKAAALAGFPVTQQLSRDFAPSSTKKDAALVLNQLSFVLNQKYVRPSYVAGIYARLGEKDNAFHWLEKAYRERDANLLFLKTDESWDSLRADPRFLSLEQRVMPTL
jgi:DNA-binding winged helix-turn-helix (wHTH) protein/tetratricopeptide (TPR) repeat protein